MTSTGLARRIFSLHVLAALAASTACKRDNAASAPTTSTPTPLAAESTDARTTDAPVRDASPIGSTAGSDAPPVDASISDGSLAAPPEEIIPSRFGDAGLGLVGTGMTGGTGEGTIGLGNIGTLGGSGVGSGMGYGAGRWAGLGRGHTPTVRLGTATIAGSLSAELVRRVTLRNLVQLRFCYEQGLRQNPQLEGRVVIRYIIGANGAVLASALMDSTLAVPAVGQCVVGAVRRWMFPASPGGGVVSVTAPYVFTTT